MKFKIFYILVCIVLVSCGSNKTINNEETFSSFKNTVNEKNIELEFEWAQSLGLGNVRGINSLFPNGSNPNNISLIGNPNYFKVKKDSLYIDLPYYGTQQMATTYSTRDNGISFAGIPSEKNIEFISEKNKAVLKYEIKTANDFCTMTLTLFPNNKGNLNVNSSRRTNISYNGNWRVVE
ncbi:DUF4251 domain-containing protein [Polaribacter sp.]|nr:DUF4251 domain-containing protein [Polaribacter sp.]